MQAWPEQGLFAGANGFAETQNNRALIRLHLEKARAEKHEKQNPHHHLDDGEAAAQRLGQRLRTGVRGFHSRMVVVVIVAVVGMVRVIAHGWDGDGGNIEHRTSNIEL